MGPRNAGGTLHGREQLPFRGLARLFLTALGISLLGYAFLGRGFAYLGIPPIYVDAFVWSLAALCLIARPTWPKMLREPLVLILVLFMIWGAIRTLPYLGVYGIDALRDGVLWGYGLFALAVAYLVWRLPLELPAISWYARYMFWLPVWAPVALVLYWLFGDSLPRFPWGPGGGTPVVNPKGGDIAVHLAGILAFWLLIQPYWRQVGIQMRIFWLGWLLSFALVGFTGRAAFLIVAITAMFLAFHVNAIRWVRVAILLGLFIALFATFGIEIDVGRERKASFTQLVTNLTSIFGEVEGFSGEGSKRWRLEWWETIVGYTFYGEYFWTGKGFGINLADDDGFQVLSDGALRSPHNGHLTVLARSGVPGFVLWSMFFLFLSVRLWLSYLRWRVRGLRLEAGIRLWVLSYLVAAMINAAFDVYLEGPQGGVWFWTLVGLGLGLLLKDKRRTKPGHPAFHAQRLGY